MMDTRRKTKSPSAIGRCCAHSHAETVVNARRAEIARRRAHLPEMATYPDESKVHEQPTLIARRRLFLAAAGLATAALPRLAAARIVTPQQMRGPFYPDRMPLDQDNDLTRLMDRDPSQGQITELTGRVSQLDGKPVKDALVEIWQCDANGRYLHTADVGGRPRDPGFQGYGKTRSGSAGGYRFRTIKPVPYPGRAPHIHVAVTAPGLNPLVTQLYVDGARENSKDFLRGLLSTQELAAVTVPFRPSGDGSGHLVARFDIVMA
jgi:protocatechuate 3,4-dioxygenase beta subunit